MFAGSKKSSKSDKGKKNVEKVREESANRLVNRERVEEPLGDLVESTQTRLYHISNISEYIRIYLNYTK